MKKVLSTIMISSLLFTVGCSSNNDHGDECQCNACNNVEKRENAYDKDKVFLQVDKVSEYNGLGGHGEYEIIDPETGVHYLLIMGTESMTMTPMYNADGTLKVN